MAAFVLSPDRQAELRALLDDEETFAATYPVVAEYLTTSAGLASAGEEGADRAFDLRLLHFMTGGESESGNPYWDIVAGSITRHDDRRLVGANSQAGSARLVHAQTLLQAAYAYAIPSPETLQWVVNITGSRRVVELGAGRGYWAAQLARHGVEIAPYDSQPPDRSENAWFPHAAGQRDAWFPVGGLLDLMEDRRRAQEAGVGGDHALLLIWPPGGTDPMASRALASYERAGGDLIVYIGEGRGGNSGDSGFFDGLAERWALVSEDAEYVSWWNLSDRAQCWRRRSIEL